MNPEFVIQLIVRARNEIAGTFTAASKDVDKLTDAQKRNTGEISKADAAAKKHAKSVDDLGKSYDDFTSRVKTNSSEVDNAVEHLQRYSAEFNKLARAAKPGSELANDAINRVKAADSMISSIKRQAQSEIDAAKAEAAARVKAEADKTAARKKSSDDAKKLMLQAISDAQAELKAEQDSYSKRLATADKYEKAKLLQIQEGRERFEQAQQAESVAVKKAEEAKQDAQAKTDAAAKKAASDEAGRVLKALEDQGKLQDQIKQTFRAYETARTAAAKANASDKLNTQVGALRATGLPEQDVRKTVASAQRDAARLGDGSSTRSTTNDLTAVEKKLRDIKRASEDLPEPNFLQRIFKVDPSNIENFNARLKEFGSTADNSAFAASRLAGNLRATVIVGAIGFFQQLVGVGVALGGTLVSIASAAVQAGAALGGALAAGAAQTIPVIGLLGAAWGRVGAVFDAVKQAQAARQASALQDTKTAKAQQTAADGVSSAAERQRDAIDAVKNAQDALTSAQEAATAAHQQETDAQTALSQARFDATRQIQDLVAAERTAQIQAESAALAQTQSQETLTTAIRTGDSSALPGASIDAQSAINDRMNSSVALGRATFDATKAVRGGVNQQPNVISAQKGVQDAAKQVADANRSIDQANRGIANAQRGITQAGDAAAEAAGKMGDASSATAQADNILQYMLSQLSPAEKKLYEAIERIKKNFKDSFSGKNGLLEPIIDSLTGIVNKASDLLGDKKLIGGARLLADEIGQQITRIGTFLSSSGMQKFFAQMAFDAGQNLPIVVGILEQIVDIFQHIASAASPALHQFLLFIQQGLGELNNKTKPGSGFDSLRQFFDDGEKYAESFIKLGGAIAQLFLAIINDSAGSGQNAVDSMTKQIQAATAWIDSHENEVRNFFREANEATAAILKAVGAVAVAIFKMFDEKQVKEFSDAFRLTLLPALTNIFKMIGLIAGVFLKIASTKLGSVFASFLLSFAGVKLVMGPLVKLFSGFLIILAKLSTNTAFIEFAGGFAKSRLLIVFTAFSTLMLVFTGRIHNVGDALKALIPIVTTLALLFVGKNGLTAALNLIPGIGKLSAGAFGKKAASTAAGTAEGEAASVGETAAAGAGGGVSAGALARLLAKFGGPKALGLVGLDAARVASGPIAVAATASQISNKLFPNEPNPSGNYGGPSNTQGGIKGFINGSAPVKLFNNAKDLFGFGKSDADEAKDNIKGIQDQAKTYVDYIKSQNLGKLTSDQLSSFASTAKGYADLLRSVGGTGAKSLDNLASSLNNVSIKTNDVQSHLSSLNALSDQSNNHLHKMGQVATDVAKSFEDMGSRTGSVFENVAATVHDNAHAISEDLGTQTKKGKDALETNFGSAVSAIQNAMSSGRVSTSKGLEKIHDLMKEALGTYGIKANDLKAYFETNDYQAGVVAGVLPAPNYSLSAGARKAVGGWVGQMGARGKDAYHTVLGAGEAVLNWGHQRLVEPAMQKMYGFGLNGMFDRVSGTHAGQAGGGMATGGFAPDSGKDFSSGVEPQIVSALRKLGQKLHVIVEGISGARTPQHSVEVGGFADDPHTRGEAADIGVPGGFLSSPTADAILRTVGLFRPFYPAQPGEINHVQLLSGGVSGKGGGAGAGGVGGGIVGVLSDAIKKITLPKVDIKGRSPFARLIAVATGQARTALQKQLDKAYKSISASTSDAGGGLATGGDLSGISGGGGAAANRVLARKMMRAFGYPDTQWPSLNQLWTHESGFITTAGALNRAYGIPQSLPANKMASAGPDWQTNPATQIKWGLEYIKGRYKTPSTAWGGWYGQNLGGPLGYSTGGVVGGKGSGDTVPAMLTPGEHVWTAAEVARAGGHQVMFALRKMLGGGGQGGPGYASGGLVKMYDATGDTLRDIPTKHPAAVASYVDNQGGYSKIKSIFPKARAIAITVNPGSWPDADIVDIEPNGHRTTEPGMVPWFKKMIATGRKPGAYGGDQQAPAYNLNTLKAKLNKAGIARNKYTLWLANWNHSATVPSGYDAHQYANSEASGANYDTSVAKSSFFGGTSPNDTDPITTIGKARKFVLDKLNAPRISQKDNNQTDTLTLRAQGLLNAAYKTANAFAAGGPVRGHGTGDTVPAMLTPGEHVWTASEVMRAGGHGVMKAMRRMLGGGGQGGPIGYADGGNVEKVSGPYVQPAGGTGFKALLAQSALAQRYLSSLSGKTIAVKSGAASGTDALAKSIAAINEQGGLLDQLSDAVGTLSDRLAANLKGATFKLNKAGDVIKAKSDLGVADATITNLKSVYVDLAAEQATINKALDSVAAKLSQKGLSAAQKNYLKGIQGALSTRLKDVSSSIADNLESQYSAVEDAIASRVTKAGDAADSGTAAIARKQGFSDLIGGTAATKLGITNEGLGKEQAGVDTTQANKLLAAAKFASSHGHDDTAKAILQQVADLQQAAQQAIADGISKDVDEVNRQAARTTAATDIRARIATALGLGVDVTNKIATDRISGINDQITKLAAKQKEAAANGDSALVEQIGDQIADLHTSVTEIIAQQLQDAIDAVDKTASRRSAKDDLQDRLSSVKESLGNYAGAFADRGATLQDRGANISSQITSNTDLLKIATMEGNQGQIDALTDKLADLGVQLQENALAVRDNTAEARQAAITDILNRNSFQGGVFGNLSTLLGSIGQLTGTTDTAGQKGLISRTIATIKSTLFTGGPDGADSLATQLLKYGINIAGQDPTGIAKTLGGLDFDSIESGMDVTEKATFESLISSVIDLTGSLVSNTQALKQITDPSAQSFSSTAWQWFRNAVFNGAGGLLPSYINPGMGVVGMPGGVYNPTPGTASYVAGLGNGTNSGNGVFAPVINNTEQTVDMDPETLANRLYFRYRTGSTS